MHVIVVLGGGLAERRMDMLADGVDDEPVAGRRSLSSPGTIVIISLNAIALVVPDLTGKISWRVD